MDAVVALVESGASLSTTVECPDAEVGFIALQQSEEERRRLAVDRTSLWKCSDILGWKPTAANSRKAITNKVLGQDTKPVQAAEKDEDTADDSDEEFEQYSPRSKGRIRADSSALQLGAVHSTRSVLSSPDNTSQSMTAGGGGKFAPGDGNEEGRNALIIVACQASGGEEVAKYLVEAGTDVEATDAIWGRTALMWASIVGRWQMVSALLESKANPDTQNGHGRTALIQACRVGNHRHVQVLVDGGADLELTDEMKHSALVTSIVHQQDRCTEILLEAGANLDDVSSGYSPLIWAVNEGTEEAMKMLLSYGAKMEMRDKHGWTALFHAAAEGLFEKASLLLHAYADTEARDRHSRTPIMLAAHYHQQALVELLLNAGALGSEYHNPTCAGKVQMAAGMSEAAAMKRGLAVDHSHVELTLTHGTPLQLMRRGLYLKRGGF
jgi:ankyrin repeat protein